MISHCVRHLLLIGALVLPASASIQIGADDPAPAAPPVASPETDIPPFDEKVRMMIRDALRLSERGRHEEAQDIAKRIQRDYPRGPELKWLQVWMAYYQRDYAQALQLGTDYLNADPSASSAILPTLASAAMLRNRDALERAISLIPLRNRALPVCTWAPAFEQALGGRMMPSSPPARLRIGAEHIREFISFLVLHGDPALQKGPAATRAAFFEECLGAGTESNLPEIARIVESRTWRSDMAEHAAVLQRLETLGVRIQLTELARADRCKAQQQWERYDTIMAEILPLRRMDGALWLEHARSLYGRGKYAESLPYAMQALKILPSNHVSARFLALSHVLMNDRPEEAWPLLNQLADLTPSGLIQWINDNRREPQAQGLLADARYIKLVRRLNWREGESYALAPVPGTLPAVPSAPSGSAAPPGARRTARYSAGAIAAIGIAGLLLWAKGRRHARRHPSRRHSSSAPRNPSTPPRRETGSDWSPKTERMRSRPSRTEINY